MIGATTAPILLPELKIPVAKARSFLGNHSAVAFTAEGKLADSPIPNIKRAKPKPKAPRAAAWKQPAKLQMAIEMA